MKIGPNFNPFQVATGLRTKRNDGDGGAARQQYDPRQNERQERDSEGREASDEGLPEKVSRAIESFQADATTVANGLRASLEGQGPGLRIVLTDVNGTVVRHFTGEEFLKLRSASAGGTHPRGKILDQKL